MKKLLLAGAALLVLLHSTALSSLAQAFTWVPTSGGLFNTAANWSPAGGPPPSEVDTPGVVNAADYAAWRARFGNTSGSGIGVGVIGEPPLTTRAVPEPAAGGILIAMVLCVLLRRK